MIKQTIIAEMNARGENPSTLSRDVQASYPTIYNFIKHDKGIRLDILEKILKHYNLKLVKTY